MFNFVVFGSDADYYKISYSDLNNMQNARYLYKSLSTDNLVLNLLHRIHRTPKLNKYIRIPFRGIWNGLYMVIQGAVFFALYIILTIGIFIITFASIGVFSSVTVSPWVTVVLSIIGILALLVAVFFIALTICFFNGKYWMFLPAICIEQKKTGATVERCNKIGRNSFYTIGLTYLFAYLIATFLPSILSSIVSLINIASGTMDIALLKIGSVFTQLITSLFQPLVTCILTALYITQRTKREGLDIENDLWEIKKEEAAKNRRWTAEALQ